MAIASKAKIDLKKELRHLYRASLKDVSEVEVPTMTFLMIDGKGNPNNSNQYRDAVEALFSTAYGLKFAVKRASGIDYAVMPLECLWWTADGKPFTPEHKGDWLWTAMIAQPSRVTKQLMDAVILDQAKKRLSSASQLRLEQLTEGKSLQIEHLGPYTAEGPAIEKIRQRVESAGYRPSGRHHEIYFNSPERTAPAKLKTLIRQPVKE